MKHYNPEVQPDPAEWLALDEQLRIDLVEAHHRAARSKLPDAKLHACFHVMVENQIAERHDPAVRAMMRLMKEGLSRHDALHAIASVFAEQLYDATHTEDKDFAKAVPARCDAAVEQLSANAWRRKK